MATLRQLRRRIKSVNSTKQITRAMEMVAASRFKKAHNQLWLYRPYAYKMRDIFSSLSGLLKSSNHPFLQKKEAKNILVIMVTSNQGLCGSYNVDLIKTADSFLNKFTPGQIKLMLIGKKSHRHYQKQNFNTFDSVLDFDVNLTKEAIKEIYKKFEDLFKAGSIDEVYIIYSQFISRLKYKPVIEKLLNLEPLAGQPDVDYISEPNKEDLLKAFLPSYLISKLTLAFFESLAAEYSARAMAMKTATDNADDLLSQLTLLRNKVRQAGITKEILEIVTTAEALK